MARKIILGPQGQLYSVTHADFLAVYQGQGYTEIGDEADPVPYLPLPFVINADDLGAWDTGPTFVIAAPDGRRYATTYQNWLHYYSPLGYTRGVPERPLALTTNTGLVLRTFGGAILTGAR